MADAYFLTLADVKVLREVLDRERSRPSVPPSRAVSAEEEPHQAPETYLARTPLDGIPLLTPASGTSPYEGTPGSADCDIFQIVQIDGGYEIADAGFTQTVFNVGSEDLAGDIFIPIVRDKFGSWLALSPSGGATAGTGDGDTVPGTGTGTGDSIQCLQVLLDITPVTNTLDVVTDVVCVNGILTVTKTSITYVTSITKSLRKIRVIDNDATANCP